MRGAEYILVDGAQPYTIPSTFGACSNAARHGRSDLGGGGGELKFSKFKINPLITRALYFL